MSIQRAAARIDARFVERMYSSLKDEAPAFFSVLETEAPTSVFINPLKDPGDCFENASSIPWCAQGKYLDRRPDFTFDPLFHAGCYYVMEASSMFLHHVLASLIPQDKPIVALDLCAAPGGKSMVVLSCLPPGSLLVSNEVNKSRFQTLQYNIDKWGSPNVIRTCLDPSRMPWTGLFDLILVDAPCSGEGLFRKDKDARAEWSPENVMHCSARQKRILAEAERLLAPGGMMVYSTCTYSDEENIHQVRWMAEQFRLTSKPVAVPDTWHVTKMSAGDLTGYQFYPHRVKGEGFFCAVLRKTEESLVHASTVIKGIRGPKPAFIESPLPKALIDWIQPSSQFGQNHFLESNHGDLYLLQTANAIDSLQLTHITYPGTEIGTVKYGSFSHSHIVGRSTAKADPLTLSRSHLLTFSPSHPLALSHCLNPEIPSIELDRDQAITYLRKESISVESSTPGWNVARYKGFALGWLKQTQAGLKNYLPTKYRIIKQQLK
ncbi:MAG TPA: hypothetical protein VI603_09850 [Saprospiraceae bacterium]|nr:hypothetical protein [Saprospiraceae bacterium]